MATGSGSPRARATSRASPLRRRIRTSSAGAASTSTPSGPRRAPGTTRRAPPSKGAFAPSPTGSSASSAGRRRRRPSPSRGARRGAASGSGSSSPRGDPRRAPRLPPRGRYGLPRRRRRRSPRPVGSLQKPWVVAAWAEAHPDEEPPRLDCTGGIPLLEAVGARPRRPGARLCTVVQCVLSRPRARDAGGASRAGPRQTPGSSSPAPSLPRPRSASDPSTRFPASPPAALLHAYRDLLTRPWPSRDDLRLALVDGMRAAALDGTGAALARRGHLVKTGTVPSLDGRPLATSGWVLAASAGGESLALALLPDGTGAQAAAALGAELGGERRTEAPPARDTAAGGRPAPGLVRIRLLEALRPANVSVSNAGDAPVRSPPSATRRRVARPRGVASPPSPGSRSARASSASPSSRTASSGSSRERLEISGRAESLRLVLSATPRAWVDGILRGELRGGSPGASRRARRGGASLPSRGTAPRPRRPLRLHPLRRLRRPRASRHVGDAAARRDGRARQERARPPAPGRRRLEPRPLPCRTARARRSSPGTAAERRSPPHEVWGRGSREAPPCPRHGPADDAAWERPLPAAALALRLRRPGRRAARARRRGRADDTRDDERPDARSPYDDLHRALAPALGWDALPSPPDAFQRTPGGFLARGRGRGHRVGLCLAAPSR